MPVIINHENATHGGLPCRFRHALFVTIWAIEGNVTTNDKPLRDGGTMLVR